MAGRINSIVRLLIGDPSSNHRPREGRWIHTLEHQQILLGSLVFGRLEQRSGTSIRLRVDG